MFGTIDLHLGVAVGGPQGFMDTNMFVNGNVNPFTSQVIALLTLYNALTTYEAQTGEMQKNRLEQPP